MCSAAARCSPSPAGVARARVSCNLFLLPSLFGAALSVRRALAAVGPWRTKGAMNLYNKPQPETLTMSLRLAPFVAASSPGAFPSVGTVREVYSAGFNRFIVPAYMHYTVQGVSL
jgi:hypothetical protein